MKLLKLMQRKFSLEMRLLRADYVMKPIWKRELEMIQRELNKASDEAERQFLKSLLDGK